VAVKDVRHGGGVAADGGFVFGTNVSDELLFGTFVPSTVPSFHVRYIRSNNSSQRDTAMGARDQIRQRFNELSPALQQVARYVLDHPNEVVTTSMRNVGTRAQSTPATLVRFAQHLGYAGWPQLKEAFAGDMGLGTETYGGRAKQLIGRAQDRSLTGEMFEVQRRNLEATHQQSEQALQKACALIEKAPAVHAAGFRACFPIAFSFVYVYRLFRASVHLVDGQGGSLEMQQRAFAKGDALVVASFMPYSREALQVASLPLPTAWLRRFLCWRTKRCSSRSTAPRSFPLWRRAWR
jgi:DNA-binding MurR/RpiR family transcriptional regulator